MEWINVTGATEESGKGSLLKNGRVKAMKRSSAPFWLSLLNEVYGIEKPAEFINFEDKVMLDTSFIDAYIPSTHVLIEQNL